MKDASIRNRQRVSRIGNGYAKLSLEDHKQIVELFNNNSINQTKLGAMFNVTPTQIRNVLIKYGYKPKTRNAGSR